MLIKLEQFVNKTTAPLSSACTFTSFGVHENVKLQPTTIDLAWVTHPSIRCETSIGPPLEQKQSAYNLNS